MVGMDNIKGWICVHCGRAFITQKEPKIYNDKKYCEDCWNIGNPNYKTSAMIDDNVKKMLKEMFNEIPAAYPQFFEPEHYHKHEIDTITFLQKGFKPEVFMGFAIGHVIKYAQRAEYKNGREDFVKMVDYAKRALDWYDKTNK